MIAKDHFDGIVNTTGPRNARHPYQVTISANTFHGSTMVADWLMENIGHGCWTWGCLINDLESKIDVSIIVVTFKSKEDAVLFNLIFCN